MNEPLRTGAREIYTGTYLGADPVTSFTGQYRFLSNPYPCPVTFEGITYPSAEHAFQAAKSPDWGERQYIAGMADWREAKRRGRALALRPDWDRVRRAVMLQVVLAKFIQISQLGDVLIATGQRMLLEGNWWGDTDWGAVLDTHPEWSPDLPWWHHGEVTWAGHNWLGAALMFTREMLAPGDDRGLAR